MRIPIPTFSNYLEGVQYVFGKNYFENLELSRKRRWELVNEFQKRARKATTKALRAMWTNLSKGQLYHAEKLGKKQRRVQVYFWVGYFALLALTTIAGASLLKWVV